MLQRFVDNLLAIAKESVKTFTYESLNNIVRLINGVSALLLAILPGKTPILEGMHGWELRPTFRGPRLPRWMENGVSSFNQFLHDLSDDSDCSSTVDSLSEDDDLDTPPGSPLSEASRSSRLSRANSFSGYDRTLFHVLKRIFSWILWVLTFMFCLPLLLYRSFGFGKSGTAQSGFVGKQKVSDFHTKKRYSIKDPVIHRTTDRRRGVVEDLQLGIEMFVEAVFDSFHKAAHFVLSPSEAYQTCCRWLSSHGNTHEVISNGESAVPVATPTFGEDDPTPTVRRTTSYQWLNTDARTCEDVIRGHGYPYEAIRVVTDDGYVLLLERIPRRDSQKVVYLQHGILDSSLGWVSNGVVGSPAFAAFDRGYDVFLGNLRGLVSREHIDKNISSRRYWNYSINEHGIQDMPAIIQKIHETKISELKARYPSESEDSNTDQPYRLCAICHSLGGAAMLMYVTTCCIDRKPHRMSKLILLSPAGFHEDSTIAFTVAEHIMLSCGRILAPFIPGLYIPTRFFRMLMNKLVRDFHNYPALGGLVQTLMSYVVGGDSSNWVGVLGSTHYNMYDMPGMSLHVAIHLAQMKHAKRFIMYDYGSAAANMEAYGSPEPLDIGQHYNLIDIPVDFVAGRKDQVIRPSMVKKHYRVMREAGVETSFNEFEYAHLDFMFSHREELLSYVMSRLTPVVPPQEDKSNHCNVKERKTRKNQVRYARDHSESEIKRLDDSDTCGSP